MERRVAVPPLATGYGHRAEEVAAAQVDSGELLVGYYGAVHQQTTRYVGRLSDGDLARIVDRVVGSAGVAGRAGALLIENNDEWLVSRRYLSEASMAKLPPTQPLRLGRSSRSHKNASTALSCDTNLRDVTGTVNTAPGVLVTCSPMLELSGHPSGQPG